MEGGSLLPILAVHLVLTGLPGAAAALLAARRGQGSVAVLLAVALCATGVVAMVAFWAYFADPQVGETWSYFVTLGSAGLAGRLLWERRIDGQLLRRLATPTALWVLGSAFLVFLGFLHGVGDPISTPSTRFSGLLPTDNEIPSFYAIWFYEHGHAGTPPVYPPDWLFSDRPPLQVGFTLAQRPFGWGEPRLQYQVLGVVLQQLWIVGLWALLVAARVGRTTRMLAMVAVLVSGFAIVNGFFVWPKLLPAAMLLAAAALVVTPLWTSLRGRLWTAGLLGALLGLAMMGHGSSVFGVVALVLIAAFRGLPSWRWLGVAALAAILFLGTWSAYQRYEDPPGNRLTKWMLGGVTEIDDRGTGEAIVDSYQEAGLGGTVHHKVENYVAMVGGGPAFDLLESSVDEIFSGEIESAIRGLRGITFFYLLPSLGLLLVAPFAMAFARGRRPREGPEWRFALTCLAIFGIGALTWGLLLYGSELSRAVIHHGSYLIPVVGICGAVVGLRAVFPRFAVWIVAASVLMALAIYVPVLDPPPGTSYSALAGLISAASLVGFGLLAGRAAE